MGIYRGGVKLFSFTVWLYWIKNDFFKSDMQNSRMMDNTLAMVDYTGRAKNSKTNFKSSSPVSLLRQDPLLKFHLYFAILFFNKTVICLYIKLPAFPNCNSRYNKTINKFQACKICFICAFLPQTIKSKCFVSLGVIA